MKCPKCHAEVKEGSLYCDKCLAEIPWVKEYNSVETLMEKKKREEPVKEPETPAESRAGSHVNTVSSLSGRKWMLAACAALILAGLAAYFYCNSFSALYRSAHKAYTDSSYQAALDYVDRALEHDPDNPEGNLLLARILEAEGDPESAGLVLRPLVQLYPDNIEVFKTYLMMLLQQGDMESIREMMDSCENPEVYEACSNFVCEAPSADLLSGVYTKPQAVVLSGDVEAIYYTMDGTDPTMLSLRYTEPIVLPNGVTNLMFMGVNELGIPSEIQTEKYILSLETPEKPQVYPEGGFYEKAEMIEILVPDGCVAFYSFDGEVSQDSARYENPISMPEGYHEFYAMLVAANGECSEVVQKTYELRY